MLGSTFEFKQHGDSGQWISELLPGLASSVDDLCVVRSMHTEQFNHSPAQLLLHTGQPRLGYPSIGSWVTYGIGSENEDLPGFVVLASGGRTPSAGKSLWGSGFLPSMYQGVQCRTQGDPILYLSDPAGIDRNLQAADARHNERTQPRELRQTSTTRDGRPNRSIRVGVSHADGSSGCDESSRRAGNISSDCTARKPGYVSQAESADDPRAFYQATDATFANNCLLARRARRTRCAFSSNSTTGAGIITVRPPANRSTRPCPSSVGRSTAPSAD